MALSVKFYGTRGQIMSVSRDRMIYGGHTSCITLKDNGDMLIFDAVICNEDRHFGNFGLLINNENSTGDEPGLQSVDRAIGTPCSRSAAIGGRTVSHRK